MPELTPEQRRQLRQNAAAMIAFADGKPIQYRFFTDEDSEWMDPIIPSWSFDQNYYRPTPEPVMRAWAGPEDVPSPCWIREPNLAPFATLIISVGADMVRFAYSEGIKVISFSGGELEKYEYSTDRKTWHPCTVPA